MKKFFTSKKSSKNLDELLHSLDSYDSFLSRMDYNLHKRRFIEAVHLRCPFKVSFLTTEIVTLTYYIGSNNYYFDISVSELEKLMSYALMHIDDVL